MFQTTLVERHKLNRETRLLSGLNEWLQSGDYCCIPIVAHGETIGLLHLEFGCDHHSEEQKPSQRQPWA